MYDKGKIPLRTDFKSFPFLRCKSLMIVHKHVTRSLKLKLFEFFANDPLSFDEKLQLLQNQLRLFKTALSDLELLNFYAVINQNDPNMFHDHSQLLDHLREVLPICDSSPFYSFHIDFKSDNYAGGNFIGQILQLPSINRCQKVYFHYGNETFTQFPVEIISNWLNRNSDGQSDSAGRANEERLLGTDHRIRIQNAVEMCDRMKMVITFYFIFNIKI